jgi:hypothetical protein
VHHLSKRHQDHVIFGSVQRMALEILVIIPPKPGKEERVAELVKWTTEEAKKNEPETSMYHAYSTTGDEQGTTDYIVHLRYGSLSNT